MTEAEKLIVQHQPIILDIACFHCQQAVEKYFKTYLVYKKEEFPKTHNLDLLQQMCSNFQPAFAAIDLTIRTFLTFDAPLEIDAISAKFSTTQSPRAGKKGKAQID
jgi:hypothetical protein